jgi:hypothetical protein
VQAAVHAAGIKPVSQNRALGQEEPERPLPGGRSPLDGRHDAAGAVYGSDTVSNPPVRRPLAGRGSEKGRAAIHYRCPARYEGWACPSDERCNGQARYGLAVRLPCPRGLRRFPPTPRATKQLERLYKGRTASERGNARVTIFWGAAEGNVTGARRFHAWVGTVRVVPVGLAALLASAPRWEGALGQTRLGPIAQALRAAGAASPGSAAGVGGGCVEE